MDTVLHVAALSVLPLWALAHVVEIIADERHRAVWIAEREKFPWERVR